MDGEGGVLAWVAYLREWRASVGGVLAWVAYMQVLILVICN